MDLATRCRVIVAMAVASALSCGPAVEEVPTSVGERGTFRIATHGSPLTLDPHFRNEALTFSLLSNVYEALTAFDEDLRIGPGLADSWENPDELTWHFHLRPGIRFHDGRPLTAEDVVFSLDRARNHPRTDFSSYLVEVEEARAVDSDTVEVVTRRPYAILLNKLAFVLVVPEGSPSEIVRPVGTGPYRYVGDGGGVVFELERFDDHWLGPAPVPRIRFVPLPDAGERVDRLLDGTVSLAAEIPPEAVDRIRAADGIRLLRRESLVVEYLQLSCRIPPFDDPRVRRAVDLALDREVLVESMAGGEGRPLGQMVGRNVFGFVPGLGPPKRDVDEARRLLEEAGYGDGLRVTLEMRVGRNGEAIRRQLAATGIEVELVISPWEDLYRRLVAGEVAFYFGGFLAPSADASDFFDSMGHTRDPERGYGQANFGRYSDPEVDRLVEESGTTLDMLRRREVLQEAMETLMADHAFLPLFAVFDLYGVRDGVEWEPRHDGWILARTISVRNRGTASLRTRQID